MKKSTYRVVKSIGLFLFLLLFGVVIYLLTKSQFVDQKAVAFSSEPSPQDFEVKPDEGSQQRRLGFDYQRE